MANTRGLFTLTDIQERVFLSNWVPLSDVWITSSPPIVTSGLVLNLDAGNTASYPGSGTSWGDLSGISGISTATGALPIYNTPDNGAFKTSGTRTDANASSLVLAIPMDGANNGTTFTDESATIRGSGTAKAITRFGDTKTSTTQSKFYGSSGFFDGTGDYLSLASSVDFRQTGDFTMECWIYPTSVSGVNVVIDGRGGSTSKLGPTLYLNGTNFVFDNGAAALVTATGAMSVNTWYHIAGVRNGNTWTLYINGLSIGSATDSSVYSSNTGVWIGNSGFNETYDGYIQDVRIYKGVAKYTANFTPPGNPNNGTLTNGPTYSSANGGAIVLDGTNDYVQLTSQSLSSVDFSVEVWFYATKAVSSSQILYTSYNLPGGAQAQTLIFNISGNTINAGNGLGPGAFGTTTISTNTWYHVVATYTASTSTLRTYINGNFEASGVAAITSGASSNFIGGSPGDNNIGSLWFGGSIPIVRAYRTKALSATEISQNYNALAGRFGLIQQRQTVRYSDGIAPPNTGYFGGGYSPVYSTMDKVTFTSDTTAAVPGANLTVARGYLASTGNSTAGYFGGGLPPTTAQMDKVTYSTDTTAAVPGANLTVGRYGNAATGTSTAGYFGGGLGGQTTMDKVTYSSDTTAAVPGAALSLARYHIAAAGNTTNGYFGGGFPVVYSTMDKVTYSTDTTAAVPGANLSTARYVVAATGNSTNGYFGGGLPVTALMDKVTYATDTTAAVPGAALSAARYTPAATGNSTNGYFGGGNGNVATMDKTTYATDTTAAVPGANLSVGRVGPTASSARANALPFPPAPTPTPTTSLGSAPAPNTGYFGGGNTPDYSSIDKVTYSTDTTARVPGANLSSSRGQLAATGNSTNGYFGGGLPITATMDKVTYATDTTAAVPGAALSAARSRTAATGNTTAGYFGGGGYPGPGLSTMDKVTYSSDTTAAVPGANLSSARSGVAATGNSTAGYFGGGNATDYSSIDKVTYYTDTTARVPGANLSSSRGQLAATGNSTAGYFGGGLPTTATMDKVTYATDTTAAVPGAALSAARYGLGATGNTTNGYFGGGYTGAYVSTMDKVTYSSDTTAAVPGANLSVTRYGVAASSARANALPTTLSVPNIV